MKHIVTKEIRSESKVGLGLYGFDFFFLLIYAIATYMLADLVHPTLKIPFFIFSAIISIFLTLPSPFNKKRRNYQTLFILLKIDTNVYRPVKNISKQRKIEEIE